MARSITVIPAKQTMMQENVQVTICKKRAAAYCRVSTDQEEQLSSYENQVQHYTEKIKNNPDHHPQKITALCLCIGAMLNLDESKDLLARAGYALSPCDKTDIIFSYFIENKIYDMIELDIQLEEHGLPCIIS